MQQLLKLFQLLYQLIFLFKPINYSIRVTVLQRLLNAKIVLLKFLLIQGSQ